MDTKEAYDWVIMDLESKREKLRRELENNSTYMKFVQLETFIDDLQEEARQFVANKNRTSAPETVAPPSTFRTRRPSKGRSVTLGDGAEKALEKERPLHATALVVKLAEMGRETSASSLSSTLIQDPRKRFTPLGGNIFTLTKYFERQSELWKAAVRQAIQSGTPIPAEEDANNENA